MRTTSPAATKRINEMSVAELRAALIDLHATLFQNYVENGATHPDDTSEMLAESFACHGVVAPMLSETNTPEVGRFVRETFYRSLQYGKFEALGGSVHSLETFYEHGQWFVRVVNDDDERTTTTFSVVDAEPGVHDSGIDFEEL